MRCDDDVPVVRLVRRRAATRAIVPVMLGMPVASRDVQRRSMRALAVAAAIASVIAACGTATGPPAVATIQVDPSQPTRTVPRSFLGISTEWDSVRAYTGPAGRRTAALRTLLAPLVALTGGLALRVGGDTADQAWWNPHGRPRPPTVLQDVTGATLDDVAWLARTLRGPVTLNVNLALADPRNARALARAARRHLPPGTLDTIEIGNEPDLYTRGRVFAVPGHVHRRLRKRFRYDAPTYRRDVLRYLAVLSRSPRPAARLAVGGFAGPAWWPTLPRLLDASPRVGAVSAHLYALSNCGTPVPSSTWLSTPAASSARAAVVAPLVAMARLRRLPVRVTELNSAPCGGRAGISDSFAAALWLTDMLFSLLEQGVDQVDVHTWAHAHYALLDVRGGRAVARPPFTGIEAFARAAPPGSRTVAVQGRLGVVRAWATVDRTRTVRLVLIAPTPTRAEVVVSGARCARTWVASAGHRRVGRACARGGRIAMPLHADTLTVLTIPRLHWTDNPYRKGPP